MKSVKKFSIRTERIRLADREAPYRRKVNSSRDIHRIAKELLDHEDQEVMLSFMLDAHNNLIGYAEIARGSTSAVAVDASMVFRHAIHLACSCIVLVHNHPSGSHGPSDQDIALTERMMKAGEILAIQILDHVIVACGESGYFSFLDTGLLGTEPRLMKFKNAGQGEVGG